MLHLIDSIQPLSFAITIIKTLQVFSSVTLIGLLIAIGFFIRESEAKLLPEAIRVRSFATVAAGFWLILSINRIFVEITNLLGTNFSDVFNPVVIKSFLTQTSLGQSYVINIAAAGAVLFALPIIKRTTGIYFVLAISFVGVLAPVFQSHSSNSGNHGLAIGSLLFHVTFISIWVGGIIGLILINQSEREIAIPRFSSLALWSAIIVSISGATNSWTRLNFREAWSSQYAKLVILKIILTTILIFIGARHRSYIARKLQGGRAVYQLLIA